MSEENARRRQPAFMPAPDGLAFSLSGNGGEDGLLVLRPLIAPLGAHVTEAGAAVIYGEGVGGDDRSMVEGHLHFAAGRDRLNGSMSRWRSSPVTASNGRPTVMLNHVKPSRLTEIVARRDVFQRQNATRYAKFIIAATPGTGLVHVKSLSKSRIGPDREGEP